MSNSTQKAHSAVLIANLIFGINYSVVKMLTPSFMSSFALNLSRVLVSIPLFWMLYFIKPSKAGIRREDVFPFFKCSLAGVVINQLLFIKGLSLTTAVHGSLLALGTPIFITAAAFIILKEKLTVLKIAGVLLGVCGAVVLVSSRSNTSASGAENMLLGDILVIINSISYALYFVWVQPLMKRYEPVHVVRWVFTLSLPVMLIICFSDFISADFHLFTTSSWLAFGLVTVGATFVSYLFNMYGLKFLGAAVTGSYIYTQPIFAVITGMILLHEKPHISAFFAAVLIMTGVYLVSKKTTPKNS